MMKDNRRLKIRKVLMIAAALMLMLVLSGCRTRISNNTEVADTISDDDGYLQEMYDERRAELGMPVAKEPFIKGSGEDEDDYDYDYEGSSELEEYMNEPWDEETYDDEDDSDSSDTGGTTVTNRTGSTQNTARRSSRQYTRKTTKKTTNNKTSGTTSGTTETTETTAVTHTVYFDGNGADMEGVTITVEEGGTYGTLPSPPARDEYTFEGWYTEAEGGTKIESDTAFTGSADQTLYAHWTEKDPEEVWSNRFDVAANAQTEKTDCLILEPTQEQKSIVEACKGNLDLEDRNPRIIIAFKTMGEDTDLSAEAQQLYALYKNGSEDEGIEKNDDLQYVIVMSDDAVKGTDRQKLLYKLALLDAMYGSFGAEALDKAAEELGLTEYFMAIYPTE